MCGKVRAMPKLWTDTIEAHRNSVADAIMDKTAQLAAADGLHALTMARIAEETGIGRATLYKYFSSVVEILTHWHQHQVTMHLNALEDIKERTPDPLAALEAVLLAYAENTRHNHGHSLAVQLHAALHVEKAHAHLHRFVAELIRAAMDAGDIEGGASPDELTQFALAAIAAGGSQRTKPALKRLVAMILRGMGA
jgi:AcrR family transcriptional regulator